MEFKRVNVNFPKIVFEVLEDLARRKGTTMTEVLRDAVALEQWVEEERAAGASIYSERDGVRTKLARI
jgi:hypothetical protein